MALAVLVTPGDQCPQRAQVVVRTADPDHEVRDAVLDVAIEVPDLVRPYADGALYLLRVAPDLPAPLIEDAALAARLLGVAVAVLVVVSLEPSCPYPKDEPSPGDVVHRARHVRKQVRVPVRVARDQSPELHPLRDLRHRPKERPALEVLAVRISVEREEVIPVEERIC